MAKPALSTAGLGGLIPPRPPLPRHPGPPGDSHVTRMGCAGDWRPVLPAVPASYTEPPRLPDRSKDAKNEELLGVRLWGAELWVAKEAVGAVCRTPGHGPATQAAAPGKGCTVTITVAQGTRREPGRCLRRVP